MAATSLTRVLYLTAGSSSSATLSARATRSCSSITSRSGEALGHSAVPPERLVGDTGAGVLEVGAVPLELSRCAFDFGVASLKGCALWIVQLEPVRLSLVVTGSGTVVCLRGTPVPFAGRTHATIIAR